MEEYTISFGRHVMTVPWWWFDALLAWLGVMGLILFFLGHRLVRPAFALAGMLGGAAFMLLVANTLIAQHWPDASPGPFIAGGAVVGALAGYILWRLEVGIAMAVVVGIVAPAAYLIVQQVPAPALHEPVAQAWTEIKAMLTDPAAQTTEPHNLPVVLEPVSRAADAVVLTLDTWWAEQTTHTKWMTVMLGIGGAAAAMFFGFAVPRFCAIVCTSLLGVLMMTGGVYRLGGMWTWTADRMPREPRNIGIVILAVTLTGVVIQLLSTRRKREKKQA